MYIDQYNTIRLHLSKTFMTLFNVFFTALGALGGLGLNAIFWGGLVCLIPDSFLIRHGAFEVPTKWSTKVYNLITNTILVGCVVGFTIWSTAHAAVSLPPLMQALISWSKTL